MTIRNLNPRKQAGFTIVELMVAATLGVLILAGTITMFINNKRMYTDQEELGRLQENARYAMEMLVRELRMSGHVGCLGDPTLVYNHLNNSSPGTETSPQVRQLNASHNADQSINLQLAETWDLSTIVEGSENGGNWQPSNSTQSVANMVAGSDGITVRFTEPTDYYPMTPTHNVGSTGFFVSAHSGLSQGDIIAIANCSRLDVLQVSADATTAGCPGDRASTGPTDACRDTVATATGGALTPGNAYSNFLPEATPYDATAKFLRFRTHRYFVGLDGNGNTALYRQSQSSSIPGDIIVDGVENMQIMYGEDTSGNSIANTYVNANAVTDWTAVVSVRIALLVRTEEEYGADVDSSTYDLLGTTVNPVDDRRRRRIVSTTVSLRNLEIF